MDFDLERWEPNTRRAKRPGPGAGTFNVRLHLKYLFSRARYFRGIHETRPPGELFRARRTARRSRRCRSTVSRWSSSAETLRRARGSTRTSPRSGDRSSWRLSRPRPRPSSMPIHPRAPRRSSSRSRLGSSPRRDSTSCAPRTASGGRRPRRSRLSRRPRPPSRTASCPTSSCASRPQPLSRGRAGSPGTRPTSTHPSTPTWPLRSPTTPPSACAPLSVC